MDATFWALVGLILFLALLGYLKVHTRILGALDDRADKIQGELDEARRLREEAQALLSDYQRKAKEAETEAEAIIAEAKAEAKRMTEETNKALAEMIERRTKTAEAKIAQAEQQALQEVRAAATDVAIVAAEKILASRTAGAGGADLITKGIQEVKGKLN